MNMYQCIPSVTWICGHNGKHLPQTKPGHDTHQMKFPMIAQRETVFQNLLLYSGPVGLISHWRQNSASAQQTTPPPPRQTSLQKDQELVKLFWVICPSISISNNLFHISSPNFLQQETCFCCLLPSVGKFTAYSSIPVCLLFQCLYRPFPMAKGGVFVPCITLTQVLCVWGECLRALSGTRDEEELWSFRLDTYTIAFCRLIKETKHLVVCLPSPNHKTLT